MFSIICPFYNSERYIEACINSVINQSFSNWELILVNDGSVDHSPEIARSFANSDLRIKLFSINNSGTFRARSYGISKCTGEYLLFLDSDDYLATNALELLNNYVSSNLDIIMFNIKAVSKNNEKIKYFNPISGQREYAGEDIIDEMFIKSNGGFGLCGCLFKTNLIENRFLECIDFLRYSEDMLLAYQLFRKSHRLLVIPYFLYYYRMNEESTTHNLNCTDYFEKYKVFSNVYNDIYSRKDNSFSIQPHIFWGFFNYITFAARKEKYSIYKKRCALIRNDTFYVKNIKKYSYESKKINLLKFLFNLRMFFILYLIAK